MATGGDMFPLWDSRNQDQGEILGLTPYERLLDESMFVLRTNLGITEVLPHLLQLGVLDHLQEAEITHNAPGHVMVDRLIRHLKTCPIWCFHSLLRACALTGQHQLIHVLNLNPDDYIQEGQGEQILHTLDESSDQPEPTKHKPEHPSVLGGQQVTEQAQLLRAITDHNQANKQTLMSRNLYDLGNSSSAKAADTPTCHIEVHTQHENKHWQIRDVAERDIMMAFPGEEDPPKVIQIYGQPGSGKTAIVQHIGYIKSVEFLKRQLSTMVYIKARSIKSTVEQAIYDDLRCRPEDKDILYNHIKTGNGSVIGLDGINEIRNPEVMENVRKYVTDRQRCGQGPCIIVTSRTDLCPIETQAFDRFLVAKGFTESQGISYITAYLTGETRQKVLEYTRIHREKLYPVITNPLRCHIFCALVSEGELELNEDDDFCIMKLFTLLEKCLLRREGKEVTIEESKRFYAMCMNGQLHGLREFSQDLLDEFQIEKSFLVLLTKKETTSQEGKQVNYIFPHEIVYEVFAGRYVDSLSFEGKKSLILSICSRPGLRNLQRIVFEVIMQQGPNKELLRTMARAILILQHEHSISEKPTGFFQRWFTLYGKLVNLHKQIQPPETLDMSLLELQSQKQAKDINKVWDAINKAFDDQSTSLKKAKWCQGLGNGVFVHVTECLQVCPSEQRWVLTKKTAERLLPCEYKDKKGWYSVLAVGASRWAEVVVNIIEVDIMHVHTHAWCPADATKALCESRKSGFREAHYHLSLHINTDQSLWGQPALRAFTPLVWRLLVVEYKRHSLTGHVSLGASTPLHGLLRVLYEEHFQCHIDGGTIGMEDLHRVVLTAAASAWHFRGVVFMYSPNVVVPAGVDQPVLRKMRDELLAVTDRDGDKIVKDPKFVTEKGVKYVWEDEGDDV